MKIPVADITPNPRQPRRHFDADALQTLANSLAQHGLVQAITVEEREDGGYQLIAGERRWRAARMLDWTEIEATVLPPLNGSGDSSRLTLALVENLHRQNMDVIETAEAYQELHDTGLSDASIGKLIGKSASNIWLYRALLGFEPEIQEHYRGGRIAIDQGLVHAMRKLDPEARVKLVGSLARKGAKTSVMTNACKRVLARDEWSETRKPGPKAAPKGAVPSIRLGARGGFKCDAAYEAAVHTCTHCDFFESPSDDICRVCPAVQMVAFLTKN